MNDNIDLPDKEYDVVAFHDSIAYDIWDRRADKKWWQLWKPKTVRVMNPNSRFWHYMKEIEATHAEVVVFCTQQEDYLEIKSLLDTLPDDFEYPATVLVPKEDVSWWGAHHRCLFVVHGSDQEFANIRRFIRTSAEPEDME